MLYTLMITITMHANYYRQSTAIAMDHVPGFQSESACNAAGMMYPVPNGGSEKYQPQKTFVCVPMGDVK